jgi:hypothetical protein
MPGSYGEQVAKKAAIGGCSFPIEKSQLPSPTNSQICHLLAGLLLMQATLCTASLHPNTTKISTPVAVYSTGHMCFPTYFTTYAPTLHQSIPWGLCHSCKTDHSHPTPSPTTFPPSHLFPSHLQNSSHTLSTPCCPPPMDCGVFTHNVHHLNSNLFHHPPTHPFSSHSPSPTPLPLHPFPYTPSPPTPLPFHSHTLPLHSLPITPWLPNDQHHTLSQGSNHKIPPTSAFIEIGNYCNYCSRLVL